jgi:hypothetical protein
LVTPHSALRTSHSRTRSTAASVSGDAWQSCNSSLVGRLSIIRSRLNSLLHKPWKLRKRGQKSTAAPRKILNQRHMQILRQRLLDQDDNLSAGAVPVPGVLREHHFQNLPQNVRAAPAAGLFNRGNNRCCRISPARLNASTLTRLTTQATRAGLATTMRNPPPETHCRPLPARANLRYQTTTNEITTTNNN